MNTEFVALVLDKAVYFVFYCSVVYALLPPNEIFNDFPGFQKYYKLIVAVIGYFALNARGKLIQLYPSVNKKNDTVVTPPKE